MFQVLTVSFRTIRHKVYCNIFDEKRYAVVEGYVREIWQRGWDPRWFRVKVEGRRRKRKKFSRDQFYTSNLVSCPLPKRFSSSAELYVSITSQPCHTQRVALRLHVDRSDRKKDTLAVCVKGMDFQVIFFAVIAMSSKCLRIGAPINSFTELRNLSYSPDNFVKENFKKFFFYFFHVYSC